MLYHRPLDISPWSTELNTSNVSKDQATQGVGAPEKEQTEAADSTSRSQWTGTPMIQVTHGRHVWTARVPLENVPADLEYYVSLRNLSYPTLGPAAAVTVLRI